MKINSHILSGILIIILGIVVSFSVVVFNYDYYRISTDIVKTEAIIQDIDLEEYKTTITYVANGETITKKLNLFDSSFKVSNETEVFYEKEEPINSYLKCEVVFFNMLLTVGLIIILTGIYFIIHYFISKKHHEQLRKNGKKIKASIESIESKKFLSLFPYHPSYICVTASIGGERYNFLSETIYFDLIEKIKDEKIKKVDVYINKEEIGDYYVDISFLKSKM